MKQLRWQILIAVLALIAIGVLLIGQQPSLQQNTPVQPVSGGVYSEAIQGSFGRLNPILDFYNQADRDITRLIFNGLVQFDDRGLPQADLAESWGISRDGKAYNFSIRPNAVWQDGQPVTSDDVIFTTDLFRNDQLPIPADLRALWKQVEVTALNQKTLQFRLPEAYAPFLDFLSFGVLPKHLLGATQPEQIINAGFNLQPVGSGPYRFDHVTSENGQVKEVVLSAFDKYALGRPYIDQIVFHYYPDARSALDGYRNGDVLGIGDVKADILPDVLKEAGLNLYTGRLPRLSMLYLNLKSSDLPFFQDADIRRALLQGINRQWMIDHILQGQAILADGPIFPGTWAYYDNIEHLDYDPDKALAVIKGKGYTIPAEGGSVRAKEGSRLSFELVYPDDPTFAAMAQEIQRDWAQLGVEVKPKAVPYSDLVNKYLQPRTYQAALVYLNLTSSPDPDQYPFWDQAQMSDGQNYSQWNDRQASEYLERARITADTGERMKAYRNFQVRFVEQMPALPLFYPVYSYAVDKSIQGVRIGAFFDPSDRFNTFASWYLRAARPVGNANSTPSP